MYSLFDDSLNGTIPEICIGIYTFEPSAVLKEMDPTAYRGEYLNYVDSTQETVSTYKCPICGETYDDQDEATYCCQDEYVSKFEVDGEVYDTEEEAQERVDELNEEEE